ncbi:MAG: membrane protein insertase YidC, partial [Acidobacteriota bacterium]
MEKRVLLAIVLSFVVLYGYQAIFPPPKPQPKTAQTEATPSTASESPLATPPVTAETPSAPAPAETAPPLVADASERDVTFENDAVMAVFTTRAGALKSWRLKKYHDDAGQPLELVPHLVPAGTPRPFTLSVPDSGASATLAAALFKPGADSVRVGSAPASLTFDYTDANGLTAHKEFTFTPDSPYVITFSATVKQGDRELVPSVVGGPGIGSGVVAATRSYNPPAQPIFYRDGSVSRIKESKIAENASLDGTFGFGGVDDHYFLQAVVAAGQPIHLEYKAIDVPVVGSDNIVAHFVQWFVRYPAAPSGARYFFGPKDFDILASVDRDLVRSIDFGMFAALVVPLLRALKWVNGFVGNFGWSIILLTVLINLAMFPLRHKSVVSMRRMQEIQPEVKTIQERYAKLKMSDPARQKMNAELMGLYRERGVNPASGCVPMLLTLPVLFAFYSMLSVAIELRG